MNWAGINMTEVLTQIIEVAGAWGSIQQADKLLDVGYDYYDIYAAQKDYLRMLFYDSYGGKIPATLDEVNAILPYVTDYAAAANAIWDAQTGVFVEEGDSGPMKEWITRRLTDTANGSYDGIFDSNPFMYLSKADLAKIETDWTNYLFRYDEAMVDVLNDIRWQKKTQTLNIAVKQGNQIGTALENSLGTYQQNIADLGSQLATYANGAAQYIGYRRAFRDTAEQLQSGTTFRDNNPFAQSPNQMWATQQSGVLA